MGRSDRGKEPPSSAIVVSFVSHKATPFGREELFRVQPRDFDRAIGCCFKFARAVQISLILPPNKWKRRSQATGPTADEAAWPISQERRTKV